MSEGPQISFTALNVVVVGMGRGGEEGGRGGDTQSLMQIRQSLEQQHTSQTF